MRFIFLFSWDDALHWQLFFLPSPSLSPNRDIRSKLGVQPSNWGRRPHHHLVCRHHLRLLYMRCKFLEQQLLGDPTLHNKILANFQGRSESSCLDGCCPNLLDVRRLDSCCSERHNGFERRRCWRRFRRSVQNEPHRGTDVDLFLFHFGNTIW